MIREIAILLASVILSLAVRAQEIPDPIIPDSVAASFPEQDLTDDLQESPLDSLPVPPVGDLLIPQQSSGPKVTPVDVDDEKPRVIMHYYDRHGEPLDEPVMFLATLDTVQHVSPGPVYPKYNGLNVGLNFGDAILKIFGQSHCSFDIWANVSLWNWLFPVVEAGIGFADYTPEKLNYRYKTPPSLYAKIGLNYNFLYKSKPDYQAFLGLRLGWSSFTYDITDISITSEYWDETQHFSLTGNKSTAFYGELLGGVQVKIVGNFSLGWTARWHLRLHTSMDGLNKPWFIPGCGGNSISMTISAIWTIPGPKRREAADTPE